MLILETDNFFVHHYSLGSMATNCFFLVNKINQATIIIDPASEGEFLSEEILSLKLQPQIIFLTHGHFDHLGGTLALFLNFQTKIFLHQNDYPLYQKAEHIARFFGFTDYGPLVPIKHLNHHPQIFTQFASALQFLSCPGHSPGSSAIYFQDHIKKNSTHLKLNQTKRQKITFLFSGDLIFNHGGQGRTDLPYSNPTDMKQSLQKIKQLSPPLIVFPGHEKIFSLCYN